ncbi:MAG: hypothetical protein ACFFE7_12495 [Candidatus Thorarchaeota archaeon]
MHRLKVLIATIVGLFLFITDVVTGWMGLTLGFPAVFIIVFIVGIIAGDGVSGFVAGLLTEFLGVFLLAAVPQILMPGYEFASDNILVCMFVIMLISVAYGTRLATEPMPLIEGLVSLLVLIIITPFVFLFALILGPIGGLGGKAIYSRFSETTPEREKKQDFAAEGPSISHEPPPADVPEEEVTPEMEGDALEAEGETESSTSGFDTHQQVSEDRDEE